MLEGKPPHQQLAKALIENRHLLLRESILPLNLDLKSLEKSIKELVRGLETHLMVECGECELIFE